MKIVCVGSSSVEGIGDKKGLGWAGRLNQYLQENSNEVNEHRVFNLGLKNDTLKGTMERYETEVLKRRPHLVIIYTGSNDCITMLKNGKEFGKPNPDKYKAKWQEFIEILNNAEHKTVILGPTMVKETLTDYKDMQMIFKNKDLAMYNEFLKDLVGGYNVELLELFNVFKDKTEEFGFDFVHPNTAGYDELFKHILEFLKQKELI